MCSACVVVLGPTGSGKSELALHVAEQCSGEIVNFDSLQLYKHLDIGTAKTPVAARRNVPHHLIDVLEPEAVFTAGEYAREARTVIADVRDRGRVPVLVGGTGFYLHALLHGLMPGPVRDTALRERLMTRERRRAGSLHRLLTRFDAKSAARIHANDVQKTVRAVEVCLLERRSMTEAFGQGREALSGFRPLKLGLDPPRAELRARIDERFARMFRQGLLDEVRALLANGVAANAKAFDAIGYRQAIAVLSGEITDEQAIASAQTETRQYAKRQMTWFRREPEVHWFAGFGDDPAIQKRALELVLGS